VVVVGGWWWWGCWWWGSGGCGGGGGGCGRGLYIEKYQPMSFEGKMCKVEEKRWQMFTKKEETAKKGRKEKENERKWEVKV
jgi:hypothetical protein